MITHLLKELRLPTINRLFDPIGQQALEQGWTPHKYLQYLCEHELSERQQRRIARHLHEAHLPLGKTLETFDFSFHPELNKAQILNLAHNAWLQEGHNILLFGPSGTGKTHLAAAIGESLILNGHRVLFTRTSELLQHLESAKRNLSLPTHLSKLDKYDCLILDDFGYVRKSEAETSLLFELICDRYERRSLLLTANQTFAEWDQIFADTRMAVAAVDRLVHHALILELKGDSYRKQQALAAQQNNSRKDQNTDQRPDSCKRMKQTEEVNEEA